MRDKIFISYSRKDKFWLHELRTHMKPLVRNKAILLWDDTKIQPGANWRQAIEEALASAKVAVLLVSPEFLASEFIAKHELPPLLDAAHKDGVKILWVHVSSSLFDETPIQHYQAAHDISKPLDSLRKARRNEVLVQICRHLKEAAEGISATRDPGTSSSKHSQSAALVGGHLKPRPNHEEPSRSPTIEPLDLQMRVRVRNLKGEAALSYELHSPSGRAEIHHRQIDGPHIQKGLIDYAYSFLKRLEKLHSGLNTNGAHLLREEVENDLIALGRRLYRELFPLGMRAAYRAFRRKVDTLLIISDEPWIPWELVKPYDDDNPADVIDDDFLCARFQLTRWLTGNTLPAIRIEVKRIACFEAGQVQNYPPLPHAEHEFLWFRELARRHDSLEDLSIAHATYPELMSCIKKGGLGIMHFVGHGSLDRVDPSESGFQLVDGRPFRPLDLEGKIQTQMKFGRPLVFFNVSRAGLGGWAPRLIRDCGCGAFIAPLWIVRDSLADLFAKTFYGELENGSSFGRAAQIARQQVRKLDPSSPVWLSYTVYANPNARLKLD